MRALRFSPTRLSLYLDCPRAYQFYYDYGLRWGRLTAGQAFGGSLHRALQRFHAAGGAARLDLEALLACYRETWVDAGYTSPAEAAKHFALGEAALRSY